MDEHEPVVGPMTESRLTYCGNVHPAENLDDWLAGVEEFAVPVAAAQSAAFGLGVWWSESVLAELEASPDARARVRAVLEAHDLPIWTLNVFPVRGFHDERVKERVYFPSWAEPERADYTLRAARMAVQLGAVGRVPLSTLPVGFGEVDLNAAVARLAEVGVGLAELEAQTGVCCVLALEPEPFCVLETAAATLDFVERVIDRSGADPERLRRHLGLCIDLCHLAVVGEDPLVALGDADRRRVDVPKIQVSACFELRDPARHLDRLLLHDEPRYLHQTVADDGTRALDLGEVRARAEEFRRASRIRTHFHTPVFWDDEGLGSTRTEVERVLPALASFGGVLEVETYTWGVLGDDFGGASGLAAGLARELEFVRSRLRS